MLGILPQVHEKTPTIKVYFEDEEAKWIFEQIIASEKFDIKTAYKHEFILVAA